MANIYIYEDGTQKQFSNVQKLRTHVIGGGTCDWIVEGELMPKTITDVGIYRPQDDGVFGYSRVTVDIPNGENRTY